ncbi:MAG: HD family phosphohydrolase, partial [Bdellovibrionaceae bacterium]|nr:HD family phosphohydrolase [Pseudobdellovibrionaceae bacterium]
GSDKNNRSFLALQLVDRTGQVDARMWENVDQYKDKFQMGEVIFIKGHVQTYQGRFQLVIHRLSLATEESFVREEVFPESHIDVPKLLQELYGFVEQINDPGIKKLLTNTLADESVLRAIKVCPAAKSIHHAFEGGLLDHVVSICKIMMFLGDHYSYVNRDYLIFGAIYHDIGKVEELGTDQGIQYTDRGRLVGHMEIACEMIDRFSKDVAELTQETKDVLKHIVLSHHGKLEYGSPKLPHILEAVLVHQVDELDSRMNSIMSFLEAEKQGGSSWTRYSALYDRYFYLPIYRAQTESED